ncbi:MAG: aldolase catalytic domain-containing protein [Bacteroidales bacterium]|nr:aldolase catalytic domain-containing protein [Bacteroidales bacterium]
MYREETKIIDCTIRDGGLMNSWKFSDELVKAVYEACALSGVDYMEIGYKSNEKSYSKKENGPWKFCDEADLRRIVGNNDSPMKISVMVDIGRIEREDITEKKESVIDMIRVACYVHQMEKAISLSEFIMSKGYESTINLMAISKVNELELDVALAAVAKSKVPILYIVDSFGSLHGEQIKLIANKYLKAMPGKTIGIHAHNNLQLAFSNTITASQEGCNMLDSTLLGLGRGAGNCPTELLLAFLKNPKFKLKQIFQVIQDYILPMKKDISWGYQVPYLITGMMNEHPRRAIEWMDSKRKNEYVEFYLGMTEGSLLE